MTYLWYNWCKSILTYFFIPVLHDINKVNFILVHWICNNIFCLFSIFRHFLSTIVAFSSRRNTRGDSDEKMRGGGPKLLCSPYFTIGTVVLLIIVIMKYYSLSSEHDNILLKVNVLQNQMKLT